MLWEKIMDLIERQLVHATGEWLLAPTEYAFAKTVGRHAYGGVAPGSHPSSIPRTSPKHDAATELREE
ncbi:hypothetical protein [Streptomyces sp. RP5T]|uniref:hypothetical protein n=1 Tax=Streptomyces sp. RP5T TaxID=2490848 RepID=UPI000F654848|nr:hypothetical protein [Streptomyces sp. RP5T]RRR86072.1 hypothetical protein EHS43_05675 [Streptomyces sp. RP5T]